MQTSIEWLWEQIDGIIPYQDIKTSQLFNGVLEQAKEMHKVETIKFTENYIESYTVGDFTGDIYYQRPIKDVYKETFNSKHDGNSNYDIADDALNM